MERYSYFRLRDTMEETLKNIKNADLDVISDGHDTLDAFKGVYEVYKILDNHYFCGNGRGVSGYEMKYDSKDENNALFLRFQRALDRVRRKNKSTAYQFGILIAARHLYDVIRANTDKDILPDVSIEFLMSIDSHDDEIITEHDAMSPTWPSSNPSVKAVFIQNKIAKTKYDDIFKPVYSQLADMAAYAVTKPAVATVLVMDVEALMGYADDIRHHYNELEAKYQEACGMISQYEEENKNLKSKLNIMTDENDCLITRMFKQDEEHTKLEAKYKECAELRESIEPLKKVILKLQDEYNGVATENAELRSQCQSKEEELRIREKEKDGKDELIEELNRKIKDLESKNKSLDFKYRAIGSFGYVGHIHSLTKKIETLEKENKELKDTLVKDGEFGKNVGKRVADSIREGCDKGVYELHPHTRIDIHVEETNNMPMTFDRHAIPRIAVMFNNTQTEMERDTAEHECEELEKKFKELVKENEDLRTTFALCERDANMARELCHTIAFNAERARNKTPWFNE